MKGGKCLGVFAVIITIYSVIVTILLIKKVRENNRGKSNVVSLLEDFNKSLMNENNEFSKRIFSFISNEFAELDGGVFLMKKENRYNELCSFGKKIQYNDNQNKKNENFHVKDFMIDNSYRIKLIFHSKRKLSRERISQLNILSGFILSSEIIKNLLKKHGKFQFDLMLSMIKILEYYDKYTQGHSLRVAEISQKIAEELGLPQKDVLNAYWTGLVHDIGKVAISTNILNKEGRLTDEEYSIIKKHPIYGFEFLSTSDSLKDIAKFVLYHHERWDGKGYPEGLKGEDIPLISRIIAIADSWDAMTSKRAYREALSYEEALQEIVNNSGKQFDPNIVEVFLEIIEKNEYNIA